MATVARVRSRRLLPAALSGEPGIEIVLETDQGEAERDRLEVFAIRQPVGAKPRLEDTAHRRNERTAAGEEHAVDIVDPQPLSVEQIVDGFFDPLDIVRDPPLEIRARNFPLDIDVTELEHKVGALRALTASLWCPTPRDRY